MQASITSEEPLNRRKHRHNLLELDYEDSPVWDILKYVAETADKAGVIGFDFRVAPDGKFDFFPKYSKTNATVIVDNIDESAPIEKTSSA